MSDDERLAAVLDAARERFDPDDAERAALDRVATTALERAREAAGSLPVEADVVQVGSTARDTWLSGDRDVDVFVRFPPDLDREALEEYGLEVGRAVLPDGHEEYAEHPYVTGQIEGFDVDVVPCYRVVAATEIQSAVDRTPFHTDYLADRLTDADREAVRVVKGFLSAVGAYGSDLHTLGFSGYLVELLVLEYGGAREFLEATADWRPPVELDPADHGEDDFEGPLVVVDPTDPGRNVAAVVVPETVARVSHYARSLLADPREAVFEGGDPEPLDPAGVREHLDRRGTTPLAVAFQAPDVVDDQLWPQLRRSLDGLVRGLEDRDFRVLRSAAFADDRAVLFVELAVADLPAVESHEGPPVAVREHAERFYDTYADGDVYGPFLANDRYVVEREREVTTAATFVREHLGRVAHGADVAAALEDGYDCLVGADVAGLADEFGVELARYFDPAP